MCDKSESFFTSSVTEVGSSSAGVGVAVASLAQNILSVVLVSQGSGSSPGVRSSHVRSSGVAAVIASIRPGILGSGASHKHSKDLFRSSMKTFMSCLTDIKRNEE